MNKIYIREYTNQNAAYCRCSVRWLLWLLLYFGMILPGFNIAEAQPSYARKENNIWIGSGVGWADAVGYGLDFAGGNPKNIVYTWQGNTSRSSGVAVCDPGGNLLFYTDGTMVWDRNKNMMPHGYSINDNGNLAPGYSFVQVLFDETASNYDGAVIIPMPGSSHKYYIFTVPDIFYSPGAGIAYPADWQGKLYCTVVDMELNNGLGDVDTSFRGVEIADGMVGNLEGLVGDNCDYWLIGFGTEGNYKAFNITSAGINTTPVISSLPPLLSPGVGSITVSPDRHRVALAANSEVQLSDFDPATGTFSNSISIGSQSCPIAAFSPNSQVLYLSGIIGIRQYDLNNLNAPFNLLMINNYTSYEFDNPLKLGADGKIYFSYGGELNGEFNFMDSVNGCIVDGYQHAGCIAQPDVIGPGCDISLLPGDSLRMLRIDKQYAPNEVPILVYDTVSAVKEAPICFHRSTVLSPGVEGTDYHWMVNTIGTTFVRKGNDSTDTLLAADPGTYAVQYYTANPCTFHRDTFIVKDVNYSLYLGADRFSCDGSPVSLDAGAIAGATYLWQDSSVNSGLEADTSGLYWVEVDKQGCTARDSVTITIMEQQDLGDDTLMCIEDAIGIPLHAHVPPGASVLWNTGATTPSIQAQDSGLYWVQVTYANCTVSDSMYIHKEYCDCSVLFPSAFSPNGDGVNDRFGPAADGACPITDYRIEVYNRWGQRVFVSFNADETWDGTVNGKPADAGTYMYRVQARSGLRYMVIQRKGDVTLIR